MKYLRWFLRAVRPYRLALTGMLFCHLCLAACTVGFVYVCKALVDAAVAAVNGQGPEEGSIAFFFGMLVTVILSRIILNAARTYLQTKTDIRLKNGLRRRLFDVLLRMQSDGGKSHHSGDILNRIQEDVRVVSNAFAISLPNIIGAALQFTVAFIFLLILDLRLGIVILVVLPVGMLVGKFITGRVKNLTLDVRSRDSKVQEHLQESIQHRTLLKSLEYTQATSDSLGDLQDTLYSSEIRRTKFSVISRIFVSLAFQTGYVVAFMWGVLGISHGTVTYGMMTAFLQLVGQIQRPLLEMSSYVPSIIHAMASVDRIMEIEALPCEEYEEPVQLAAPAGIRMENVTFAYPDSADAVLEGFSHDFAPGSRTAIVGPTGVGKSTMIRLLMALLEPQAGEIRIYDRMSGDEKVSSAVRCNMVYVPQGNSLFSGTIRDNLLMGNPEASEQQMWDVLDTAAAGFVSDMPHGLDTQCFEAGAGLSEGQAQRIAIARALLRPGSILLLDEFSSALDAETEILLMNRLTSRLSDRTMIFITHREKIIDYCTDTLRLG